MSEYIKRDEVIKALHDLWREFYVRDEDVDSDTECFCGGILTASHTIAKIPSADVIEHKRGEWLWDDGYFCSECHGEAFSQKFTMLVDEPLYFRSDFCPNCGADMREREGE